MEEQFQGFGHNIFRDFLTSFIVTGAPRLRLNRLYSVGQPFKFLSPLTFLRHATKLSLTKPIFGGLKSVRAKKRSKKYYWRSYWNERRMPGRKRRRTATSLSRAVKRIITKTRETKHTRDEMVSISTQSHAVHMTSIAEGSSFAERDGAHVNATGLYLHFTVVGNTAINANVYRIIVISLNGAYEATPLAGVTTTSDLQHSRFKVHYDRMFSVCGGALATGLGNNTRTHRIKLRFKTRKSPMGMPIEYALATGSSALKNDFFYAIISKTATAPTLDGNCYFYYQDN